jgi:hypothetical protein
MNPDIHVEATMETIGYYMSSSNYEQLKEKEEKKMNYRQGSKYLLRESWLVLRNPRTTT